MTAATQLYAIGGAHVRRPETAMTVSISQPGTVSALLRELGMSHACVEKTRIALGTWLTTHEPGPPLRLSLRENGYGPLVSDFDDKHPRSAAEA
jgi:hypothetical protein